MGTAPAHVGAEAGARGAGGRVGLLVLLASITALIAALGLRAAGPSDLWDQVQPRTISYTTDIIVHGRWVLPMERGARPATKPPLYNWIAVPAVVALGFPSEIAHKMPSVLAALACWLLVVRFGRARLGADVGWLAGLMFVANYTIFKLGYLARPDMVLCAWLLLGWVSVTALLVDETTAGTRSARWGRAALFWLCFGMAGLTKGPPALLLPLYAVIAARLVAGRWSAVHRTGWWWGAPLGLAMIGAWLYGVWRVDPAHLREELWFAEVYGRASGVGPEGDQRGPIGLLATAPNMVFYFVIRFLPWSVAAVLAVATLWTRGAAGREGARRWRTLGERGAILHGAAIFVVLVILFYTASAGKRADYAAPAFAPGALLAAWWVRERFGRVRLTIGAGVVTMAVLAVDNGRQPLAPAPGFGDAIRAFAIQAEPILRTDPRPTAFYWTGDGAIQALLGYSQVDSMESVVELIDSGQPFRVVGGIRTNASQIDAWLRRNWKVGTVTPRVQSALLPRAARWPGQITVYDVEPPDPR